MAKLQEYHAEINPYSGGTGQATTPININAPVDAANQAIAGAGQYLGREMAYVSAQIKEQNEKTQAADIDQKFDQFMLQDLIKKKQITGEAALEIGKNKGLLNTSIDEYDKLIESTIKQFAGDPKIAVALRGSLRARVNANLAQIATHQIEQGKIRTHDVLDFTARNYETAIDTGNTTVEKAVAGMSAMVDVLNPGQDNTIKKNIWQSIFEKKGAEYEKKMRVDVAATEVQQKFNLTSAAGNFEGAYLYLMEPKNREELNITFDDAQHIMTSLKNQHLLLTVDARKGQDENNKIIRNEYAKLLNSGRVKEADNYLRDAENKGNVEPWYAYEIREKVRTDLEQQRQAGRAATLFSQSQEKRMDDAVIQKAIGDIYQKAKPGTGDKAVAKFKEGIANYGIAGKQAIESYMKQIVAMPEFNKGNKSGKLAEVLGKKPTDTSTAVTVKRRPMRNPATGEVVEWDGTQWKIVK